MPGELPALLQGAAFAGLLTAASLWDVRKRVIPNTLCVLILLAGLMRFSPANVFGILTALPLLVAAMLKPDGMGGGDVKLTAACGFVLGFGRGVAGLALGLALTLLFYGALRLRRGAGNAPKALPLAPFLSCGFLAAYFLAFGGVLQ